MYRLYDKPSDRLKEALGLSRQKRYRELYALNDVSFVVNKGETVGIIGTNGSGKSTILKIITGVLSPTAGDVKVNGRISALLDTRSGEYEYMMSILKSADGDPSCCERFTYSYDNPKAGEGHRAVLSFGERRSMQTELQQSLWRSSRP